MKTRTRTTPRRKRSGYTASRMLSPERPCRPREPLESPPYTVELARRNEFGGSQGVQVVPYLGHDIPHARAVTAALG